jgi:hypothetical protein
MIFTVRKPWLLRIFGWNIIHPQQAPEYVTADHKLWLKWLLRRC